MTKEELQELFQLLFYDNLTISGKRKLKEEVETLQQKYNKALYLLSEYNMPCERDNFMIKNDDYCSKNCGVENCWDEYIKQKLEKSDKE